MTEDKVESSHVRAPWIEEWRATLLHFQVHAAVHVRGHREGKDSPHNIV